MTLSTLLVILAAGLAGLALVAAIRLGRRVRLAQTRGTRQAPTEPAHRRPATATRGVLLPALRNLVQHRRPPVHPGATLGWSPAAAVAHVGTAPELTTLPMAMVADHHALDTIAAAQQRFGLAVEAALDQLLRDDPLTRMRITSGVEQTAEWDATGLRALLAAEDALAVAR